MPVRFGKVDQVNIGSLQDVVMTVPRGQAAKVKTEVQVNPEITAPIAKGDVLGKILVTLDGQLQGEQALVALEPVDDTVPR